jgi:hypothetical protein
MKCCLFCLENKTFSCIVFVLGCNAIHYQTAVSDVSSAGYRQNYGIVSSDTNDLGVEGEYIYIYQFL